VEGSCEHGNEPSGSIKFWEVPEWLQTGRSPEGLSSMKFVRPYWMDENGNLHPTVA
jgi:hypothetical protein